MTQDKIIRMARDADLICESRPVTAWLESTNLTPYLTRFAALVAAHEREKQAKQEPVAWMWNPSKPFPQYTVITDNKEHLEAAKEQGVEITPLYAAPVRTKDLTDDEIVAVHDKFRCQPRDFARAVIAAYKEKNK